MKLSDRENWRKHTVIGVMAVFGVALALRLVQLQGWDRATYAAHANRQHTLIDVIPARPGEIVDRRGRLLATTVSVQSLFVDPSRITEPLSFAKQLAPVIGLDAMTLAERITARADKQFIWAKRRLSEQEATRVRELGLPSGTWGFRSEYLRRYPQGSLGVHVIGFRDLDGVGRGGLEQSCYSLLRGTEGRRFLVRDARGRVIEVQDAQTEPPRPGRTLVLTLDTVIQLYAERALDGLMENFKPKAACAIVLDPLTGDVLAAASRPTFDPNNPVNVPEGAWNNAVVAAMFEPGSTFKPFIVAWGLQRGLLDRDEMFDCEFGQYRMGRRILHDHHPYGWLNLTDVLVKSSNVGMAKIGEKLTNQELYRAAVAFGFGSKTGCELPGELQGVVRPLKEWTDYSTGSVPMGHEIAVTPLQLITGHAALANGGKLISPHFVLCNTEAGYTGDWEQHVTRGTVVSQTVSADIAKWVVSEAMAQVVARGTGKQAKLTDYAVFGKTGTAEKPDPLTGEISRRLHVSSFVGGAPADNPRVMVLVLADEPAAGGNQFGGSVAAPTAKEILRNSLLHLGVPATKKEQQVAEEASGDIME